MKRVVEIISTKMKYRKATFPAVARYDDDLGNYRTGQEAKPGDSGGLTVDEIENPEQISAARRKKYPFIIKANQPYHVKHMSKFDITLDDNGNPVNYKDYVLFNFFKSLDVVAPSEKEFKPDSMHIFYIRDKEKEATDEVSKMDKWYEAMQLVKENTAISNLENIALMLNYNVPNFSINISASSKARLEKEIYKACMDHPDQVLKCFEEGSEEIIFVLKLVRKGIISRRQQSFYDGEKFLGTSVQEVLAFTKTKDGESYRDKWGSLLNKK